MAVVHIGIDDTDNETSPGTGRMARRLSSVLAERGARELGITRHQFLKDSRIPFTSHNSGACVAVEWAGEIEGLNFVTKLIADWSADGSDPGVCIVDVESVRPAIIDWGWAATRRVLTMDHAQLVARDYGIQLHALGGTGQGIIGAMASVGLRADGNEGRFLHLPGLRDLGEYATRDELTRLGIHIERRGEQGADDAVYKTLGWVRPRLVLGKPVWPVEWSAEHHVWIPIDRKKQHHPK